MSVETFPTIANRKDDHLEICENQNVASSGKPGWEAIDLPHCALPDLDFDEIDLGVSFLNENFSAPFLISSMTGGSERGEKVNSLLAEFAQSKNIPMGVGSQRIALENKNADIFGLRKVAPTATLYANLGAVQFNYGVSAADCLNLIEKLQAQAFILHLNPLQEAIQNEGDRNFKGLWQKIEEVCKKSPVPVILKETGCGLDPETCVRAMSVGVSALDVAGFGGTHWGYIEGLRNERRAKLGETFRGWGTPTAVSIFMARSNLNEEVPIIASGGIRNGLDAAKAFYLGANLAGLALPFLKAASAGEKILEQTFEDLCESLRISLFCTNCKTVDNIQVKGKVVYENQSH